MLDVINFLTQTTIQNLPQYCPFIADKLALSTYKTDIQFQNNRNKYTFTDKMFPRTISSLPTFKYVWHI